MHPTINIKFYACCTFQKPQEDIDSSKCHILNDLWLFTLTVLELKFAPRVGDQWKSRGGVVSHLVVQLLRGRAVWVAGGRDVLAGGSANSHPTGAHPVRGSWRLYVFHYTAGILRKLRGLVLSGWFGGESFGAFYKLYFVASLQEENNRFQWNGLGNLMVSFPHEASAELSIGTLALWSFYWLPYRCSQKSILGQNWLCQVKVCVWDWMNRISSWDIWYSHTLYCSIPK